MPVAFAAHIVAARPQPDQRARQIGRDGPVHSQLDLLDVLCDFWNVNRSQVYRELGRLSEDGLVEAGERGVRDQVPHTITDAGREAFLTWLHQDPGPEIMRSPLHLKLSFAEHLDDATRSRFIRLHQLRNEERLAYYRSIEQTMGDAFPYEKHVLRSGIAYREGLLAWLDSLP